MKQEARPSDGLESPGFSRGEEVNPSLLWKKKSFTALVVRPSTFMP